MYALTGAGETRFKTPTQDGSGFELQVNNPDFDHETEPIITINVRVYDDKNGNSASYADGAVKIEIADNNEEPSLKTWSTECVTTGDNICPDNVGKFGGHTVPFSMQETDTIGFFTNSKACNQVEYVWDADEPPTCYAQGNSLPVAAVYHSDPDGSSMKYTISAVQAMDTLSEWHPMNTTLFTLKDCEALSADTPCGIYRSQSVKDRPFFDYELYSVFKITLQAFK